MNKLMIAAALMLSLSGTAFAGEGNGHPFEHNLPGIEAPAVGMRDVGQSQLPNFPAAYSFSFNGVPVNQPNGQEGVVETANSLPQGALVDTIGYAQQQSAARWFASHRSLNPVRTARAN